jgi:hypothetical protein
MDFAHTSSAVLFLYTGKHNEIKNTETTFQMGWSLNMRDRENIWTEIGRKELSGGLL